MRGIAIEKAICIKEQSRIDIKVCSKINRTYVEKLANEFKIRKINNCGHNKFKFASSF